MAVQICLCALAVLSAALFIIVRVTKGGALGILTKTFASFCFLLYGVISLTQSSFFSSASVFIILGLVCGLIGDIVLDLKYVYKEQNDIYLNGGMLSFSVGHVFYFVGTIILSQPVVNLLAPILVAAGVSAVMTPATYFISKKMGLDFGKFLWQSMGYCFILNFMTAFTIYLAVLQFEFIILACGMALFLLSDLVLSMQYFGGKTEDKLLTIVNHGLYYAAQILIATFLFLF